MNGKYFLTTIQMNDGLFFTYCGRNKIFFNGIKDIKKVYYTVFDSIEDAKRFLDEIKICLHEKRGLYCLNFSSAEDLIHIIKKYNLEFTKKYLDILKNESNK